MDKETILNIRKWALERLQVRHKAKDLQITQTVADEVPSTGCTIFQLAAVHANDPEGPFFEIAVDENGEEVDLKALSKREGRVFFGGDRRPKGWPYYKYSYSVKFVCGAQEATDGCCCPTAVRPGIYATEINIHNYHPSRRAVIDKYVLPVVFAGMPVGREPRSVRRRAHDAILLPPDSATMDDCCRISELLYESAPPAGNPLTIGYLEIVSDIELKVTAVYTATDRESRSVSIDVEDVAVRRKGPFYWWPWIVDDPGTDVANPLRGKE